LSAVLSKQVLYTSTAFTAGVLVDVAYFVTILIQKLHLLLQ